MERNNIAYYLKKNFNRFKNKVIEAMINYYGEEYKDIIIKRLDDTIFMFYGNVINGNISSKQSRRFKKEIIYKTKDTNRFDNNASIKKVLKEGNATYLTFYDPETINIDKVILFPIYESDETLIHEMIHAVANEHFFTLKKNSKKDLEIHSKNGLITSKDQGEILLEETITEIEANNIYNILKENGFKSFLIGFDYSSYPCYYDNFIPLVNDFYETFFNDITYSRFTPSKSTLINKIGIENYYDLVNYISCFEEEINSKRKDKYYTLIESIVSKMENSYKVKKLV